MSGPHSRIAITEQQGPHLVERILMLDKFPPGRATNVILTLSLSMVVVTVAIASGTEAAET